MTSWRWNPIVPNNGLETARALLIPLESLMIIWALLELLFPICKSTPPSIWVVPPRCLESQGWFEAVSYEGAAHGRQMQEDIP